jgi:DNA-binding MarR family transcriptional regulator
VSLVAGPPLQRNRNGNDQSMYTFGVNSKELSPEDYRSLAEFRYQIRRFLNFSEAAALAAGLNPKQHQLLLALKGLPHDSEPTIGRLASRLHIRPHSAVELIDRLCESGHIRRRRASQDRRQVLIEITRKGEAVLQKLSLIHRQELESAAALLVGPLNRLMKGKAGQ